MIIVGGEALIDLIVQADGSIRAVPGGSPYNTARTLARLGIHAAFVSRLSSDRFGRQLSEGLAADGVDVSLLVRTDEPTTLALAELDASGSASYHFYLAGTASTGLRWLDVEPRLPASTEVIHIGSLGLVADPTATTLETLVARARPDALVSLDPNCRPGATADPVAYRQRLGRIMRRVDLVKTSQEDLAFLDPEREAVPAARHLLGQGVRLVLLTDGPRPLRAIAPTFELELAVPSVQVRDTVGAGDAIAGGFHAEWLRAGRGRAHLGDRDAVRDAMAFALRVAAVTCQRLGADPPTRAELEAGAG